AEIERLVDHFLRCREIDAAAEIVAAEPDRRHAQPRTAEISLFHPLVPPCRRRSISRRGRLRRSLPSSTVLFAAWRPILIKDEQDTLTRRSRPPSKIRIAAAGLAMTILSLAASAAPPGGSHVTVILAFGDSLTAGLGLPAGLAFPARLQAWLCRKGFAIQV